MQRVGRAVRVAAVGLACVVGAGALAACGPVRPEGPGTVEDAAAARRATRDLADAQRQVVGCDDVVMGEEPRTTAPPDVMGHLTGAIAYPETCWDRILFTFESELGQAPPGYQVEYRKPPFTEGERESPVRVEGEAFLSVTFSPASQFDLRDPARPIQTYKGNLLLDLGDMHHVTMVRKLIDGLGTVMWLIGLDEKRPFTVDAVSNPPRVSIFIAKDGR